jgi:crossover junction endodeoxyribonuclease RuvC
MFVLGVDPGLTRCGYCALEVRGRDARAVALGVIRTSAEHNVAERLCELQDEIDQLLNEVRPAVVALERVLFSVNVRTAMSVGQASGIVMASAARRGVGVVEYSPNEVKATVTGSGNADKAQVGSMVQRLLGLDSVPSPPDAADAAAIALCHAARAPLGAALAGARR